MGSRADGRDDNQLRQMECSLSTLVQADGSCRLSHGDTCVVAAVYGPRQVKQSKEIVDRATIQATVHYKNDSSDTADACADLERSLHQTFESVVLTALHPRTLIHIVVQIIHENGSLTAACFNATTLALADAGIPMRTMISASCCSIQREGLGILGGKGNGGGIAGSGDDRRKVYLDPTTAEENAGRCSCTLATVRSAHNNVEDSVAFLDTVGAIDEQEFESLLSVGHAANECVATFCETALRRKAGDIDA